MRSSQLSILAGVLLLTGCGWGPFGDDSGIKTPAYYGTYSIGAEGETTQMWSDDAAPELPETVRFLVHEKASHLGADAWPLARLSVAGPSVAAGALSWHEWYHTHGLTKGLVSAIDGSFPVNANPVRLKRRPVKGEDEMIILEPAVPLTPGPYQLGDGLRFWVARQQFNLEISAAADAAVQEGDLRRAYNLAESAKLWNASNPAIVAQFSEVQVRIEQVDGGTSMASVAQETPAAPVAADTARPEAASSKSSSATLAAEAAFRQATTAFDEGEWVVALQSSLEAMAQERTSKKAVDWPDHRSFKDPIDILLGIVTRPETADPLVVCETAKILAIAGERRGPPAMVEALSVICLERDAASRLDKKSVLCLVDALVDMDAGAATHALSKCLGHVLSGGKRATATRYVNALAAIDSKDWERFSPDTLGKVYDAFIEVNDRGAEAVRHNPIDTKSANLGKVNDFLTKIGRWDVTDAANRSGLELGGSIGTKIRDKNLVEMTYRITGQSSLPGDRFTLIMQPSPNPQMPWRITDIRDVIIHRKPFTGDATGSEFEPVAASPIDNVSISPINIGDNSNTRTNVAPEPDIDTVVGSRPGGPRIASRPDANPKDIVAAICPGGTLGPLRHGSWYKQYFQDDALVDVRPANDPSPEEHNETRDLIHTGIDILAPEGSPVYALAGGIVRTVISNPEDGSFRALGYAVVVRHAQAGNKKVYCLYSHLNGPPKLLPGNNVTAGILIGHTGTSGSADQPQVHVEIRHFDHLFDNKLFDVFGNPMQQDPETLDMEYLHKEWSDPLQFPL